MTTNGRQKLSLQIDPDSETPYIASRYVRRNFMKCYQLIILVLILSSCESTNQKGEQSKETARNHNDSCSTALLFKSAAAAEAMVEKNYSGQLTNYWGADTTKLDFIHVFKDGKLISSRFYHENGQVQEEHTFLCGALHGLQKFYYDNAVLAKTIPYRYGRANGIGRLYDEKGTLRQEVTLLNDSIILTRNYDQDSKLNNQ